MTHAAPANLQRVIDRPTLQIAIPLEGQGAITIAATSYEDEHRLRSWLRRSGLLDDLAVLLTHLLDDLDAFDEERAA